jgi:ribosome biogenesis ATPase
LIKGCGKTLLANAIAGEANVPFISIAAPVIVSGMSGESEKKIREVFEEAKQLAPCILFIDEIDAITPKRETAQREMERRIVAQLLTCMDDLSLDKTDYKPVMIIGATNRPDSLYLKLIFSDPALRRAGRFDREILLGVPNEQARTRILQKMCGKLRLEGSIDFQNLARLTPGYVGADLNALTAEAGLIAVRRIFGTIASNDIFNESTVNETGLEPEYSAMVLDEPKLFKEPNDDNTDSSHTMSNFLYENNEPLTNEQLQSLCVRFEDFVAATKIVQPSSKREGFASVPDVSWEDIGALYNVAEELRMAIVEPIKHPERFSSVGIESSMGVLLYGPPGCGKTLLAKAVANESQCNFLSVKGPELLNKVNLIHEFSMSEKVSERFEWYFLEHKRQVHVLYSLMNWMPYALQGQMILNHNLLQD